MILTKEERITKEKEHLVTDLPAHFKNLLNKVYDARFMQKRQKEMIKYSNQSHLLNIEEGKQYLGLDWQILNCGKYDNYDIGKNGIDRYIFRFGIVPHYQHDELVAIHIDMERKKASIVRGIARGPWASGLLQHSVPIQRYFKETVDEFWKAHEEWVNEKTTEGDKS